MKKIALIAVLAMSFSALAYETRNATSYSGPRGGVISGSTELSGTSVTALREQVVENQQAVAAFLQSDASQANSAEVAEIADLARKVLHEKIEAMSDREVIEATLE